MSRKPLHQRSKQDVMNDRFHNLQREKARQQRHAALKRPRKTLIELRTALDDDAFSMESREWFEWAWKHVYANFIFVSAFLAFFIWMAANAGLY